MSTIIEVKNLGKKYNIGQRQGYVALRDTLANIAKSPAKWFGRKMRVGLEQGIDEEFWALKDVNFTVEKGEVLGIVGRNGAGKSTLLKILSQITPPTTGEIRLRGRVGSLLEVGTGFHPELTGRENIFLNGAILGMRKKEIEKKFAEIVEFSGVEKFLDMPVKRYSSGMYVRLAFSVAAHMDPEILIVDEVLAVGDADFQKKCLGKMEDVTKRDGRTVLFVSHNMAAVRNLCSRTILLENGMVKMVGKTEDVLDYYLNDNQQNNAVIEYPQRPERPINITKISIFNQNNQPATRLPISEKFFIKVEYDFKEAYQDLLLSAMFWDGDEMLLYTSESDKSRRLNDYEVGKYETTIEVPAFIFNLGTYHVNIDIHTDAFDIERRDKIGFEVVDGDNPKSMFRTNYMLGKMSCLLDFKTNKI